MNLWQRVQITLKTWYEGCIKRVG